MTTAGSAGRPAVSFGPFVPPRFGRRSTPPATYLSLMVAILHQWALARAITLTGVTSRRIHTAGAVLPTTLRIIRTLAAASAAAEKVLVNARRAVRRAVDNLTQYRERARRQHPPGAVNRASGNQCRITTTNRHTDPTTPGSNATKHPRPGPDTESWSPQPGQFARPSRKTKNPRSTTPPDANS